MAYETIVEDGIDVLVVGAGLGGTGAAWEARFWGQDKKIVIAEKANIDRSGAVAQGLYAINCYMGTRWGENKPEDHVRYARIDLMGMVREDLLFDMARHVDSTVHQFEEWGLPIMKDPKTGRYLREGRWQIMIHGESYKPIVAEAAKKSADKVFNRICVTHLLMDDSKENRVAGAVGFNVRTGNYHVFKSKTVICGAGGAFVEHVDGRLDGFTNGALGGGTDAVARFPGGFDGLLQIGGRHWGLLQASRSLWPRRCGASADRLSIGRWMELDGTRQGKGPRHQQEYRLWIVSGRLESAYRNFLTSPGVGPSACG